MLARKTEFAQIFLTVLNIAYFLQSGFFSNLRLPWKTERALNFFTVLNIFLSSRIWATCACPGKQNVPWNFSLYWNINYLSFRIFEQLALALKNKVCPRIFTVLKYFVTRRNNFIVKYLDSFIFIRFSCVTHRLQEATFPYTVVEGV